MSEIKIGDPVRGGANWIALEDGRQFTCADGLIVAEVKAGEPGWREVSATR